MTITARVALVAIALAAVATTACGRSTTPSSAGSASTASPPAITKAQFLAKAQRLCDRYNAKIGAIGGGAHDPATRNADARAILGLIRQHVADARALGYPPGDRPVLEPIWNDMDSAIDKVQRRKDHPNIQQEIGEAFGSDINKLQAYGTC